MNPLRICLAFAVLSCFGTAADVKPRVLILSGANNHDWKSTTPAIRAALEESGRFSVDVEENVFAMTAGSFAPYAVVLSNFNTFGKDAPKGEWSAETKKAFLDHMAKGRGLVIVHAGSSGFYDWPEFQNLACGTWKDGTSHGAIHVNRVSFSGEESPITQGLAPFWIRDEFWQKTTVAPGAKALASVTPDPAFKGSGKPENIIFTTESGGGRGFAIFLGHDAEAMGNPAWRTLLQRGTEWAATGKVTIPPAKNWPATKEDALRPGYGGYAGLSLRLPVDSNGWSIRTSEGKTGAVGSHGQGARWVDFSGPGGGIAICDHPDNLRHPSPWYVHDSPPMSFFSPAVLFNEPLVLAAGQSLKLSYRVLIHSKPMSIKEIETDCHTFAAPAKP